MRSHSSISYPLLLLLTALPYSTPTCFLPNGTEHLDSGTSRCSSSLDSPLYYTCCQSGWPNPPGGDVKNGPTADECLPNGLCQNRGWSSVSGGEKDKWTHFYRVYCANENWEGCLDVCRDGTLADQSAQLTPCDGTATSEYWCCGDSHACCDSSSTSLASKKIRIPKELGSDGVVSASAQSASSIAESTSSAAQPISSNAEPTITGAEPTSLSTAAATNLAGSSEGDENGEKSTTGRNIGIGVGVGVGVGALLGAIVTVLLSRKRAQTQPKTVDELPQSAQKEEDGKVYAVAEMAHQEPVYELHDGSRADLELDASNKPMGTRYQ